MITQVKKLKHNSRREHSGEDLEGRTLKKLEENHYLKNCNQELENQIKKLEIDKKPQLKIQNHNNLIENQEAQIQENASKNQIEEVKKVFNAVQKKEKQTTHTPYRHYNRHFDQRQDQNKHSQKNYVDMRKDQLAKQQVKRPIPQNDLRAPIKLDMGWTTTDTTQQFSLGIYNSYRLISS